ncbi:unnamed protein product [Caenorhabditis nigoni]
METVVFNPEVDIGFISHNLRIIGEEHPERQQLIMNVMRSYLEVFNSNSPANTTPEDVYGYLARERPDETGPGILATTASTVLDQRGID